MKQTTALLLSFQHLNETKFTQTQNISTATAVISRLFTAPVTFEAAAKVVCDVNTEKPLVYTHKITTINDVDMARKHRQVFVFESDGRVLAACTTLKQFSFDIKVYEMSDDPSVPYKERPGSTLDDLLHHLGSEEWSVVEVE
jgi:hypothetical protein